MKALGVQYLLSVSAVGSMREVIAALDMVLPDQFIDFTLKREVMAQACADAAFTGIRRHESGLAREAEIAYSRLALATDWDFWRPHQACVTGELAIANLQANAQRAQALLGQAVRHIAATCRYRRRTRSWAPRSAHGHRQ